ncbi:MAG: DNA-binding protein [Candidatus Heimdallarchaeota archaeon]
MSSRRIPVEFTWHQYYDLAQQFYDDSDSNKTLSEALLRSAISRAYFATHCLARNYLLNEKQLQPPKDKKDMHSWVIDQISKDPNIGKVHIQLNRLRDDRNKADYEDVVRRINRLAEGALLGARKAIEILDQL